VTLGRGRFLTDRGYRSLPAWRFSLEHVADPVEVLAVSPSHTLQPATHDYVAPVTWAQGNPAARTLTLFLQDAYPAGRQPCDASYTVGVVTDREAVAVTPDAHEVFSPTGETLCSAVGYTRRVRVQLPSALGGRLLVNTPSGDVVPVSTQPPTLTVVPEPGTAPVYERPQERPNGTLRFQRLARRYVRAFNRHHWRVVCAMGPSEPTSGFSGQAGCPGRMRSTFKRAVMRYLQYDTDTAIRPTPTPYRSFVVLLTFARDLVVVSESSGPKIFLYDDCARLMQNLPPTHVGRCPG
jgi:hypothetical protein